MSHELIDERLKWIEDEKHKAMAFLGSDSPNAEDRLARMMARCGGDAVQIWDDTPPDSTARVEEESELVK